MPVKILVTYIGRIDRHITHDGWCAYISGYFESTKYINVNAVSPYRKTIPVKFKTE